MALAGAAAVVGAGGQDRSNPINPPEAPLAEGIPRQRRRPRDRVAGLLKRLRRRSWADGEIRRRLRRRKAALALSAGIMGISTAAMSTGSPPPAKRVSYSLKIDRRLPAPLLNVSDEMKKAMIEEEGVRYTVYRDVAGYPTVGVGHLIKTADGLNVGDTVTKDQVLDFLELDLKTAEAAVVRLVGELPLFQHEFDALVDLVFNVGEGNVALAKSPRLNEAIATGDYLAIAEELDYHHAAGSIANGLVFRSERRTNIFSLADYENTRTGAFPGTTT